ncbi:MAG: hypothetical protein AAF430_01420 [Myxococcota bacterium]
MPGTDGGADWLSWSRISLRRSFQSEKQRADAASLGLSAPRGASDTFSITGALVYDFTPNDWMSRATTSAFVELQRNSDQDKEQNLILSGVSIDALPFDSVTNCAPRAFSDCTTPIVIGTLNHRHDEVGDTESAQASVFASLLIQREYFRKGSKPPVPDPGDPRPQRRLKVPLYVPNHIHTIRSEAGATKLLSYEFSPYVGLEYDGAYRVKSGTDQSTGSAIRVAGKLRFALDVLPGWWGGIPVVEGLTITGDGQLRQDIKDTIEYDGGPFYPYGRLTIAADVYRERDEDGSLIERGRSAGIGLDLIAGEDPSKAFLDQRLLRLTFNIRL